MAQPTASSPLDTPDHATLHNEHHNVKSYGAVGDFATDDTAAFEAALTAILAIGSGHLHIPPGTYIVDGDAILALIDGQEGWIISGAGNGVSTIMAKEGSSCAFGVDGAVNFTFRDLQFRGTTTGGGEDGFRMYGNSRANSFINCRFNLATNGFYALEDPAHAGQDQNERNLFLNCHADNSDVGYKINSANAQEQLFIGGGSSSCNTAFYGTAGWGHFIGWFCTTSNQTGWKTDGGWIQTTLDNCLDEASAISFDLGAGDLVAQNTYFQGITNTVKCTAGTVRVSTENCYFNGGDFNPGANSMWWSRNDSIAGGDGATGTYTPNASAVRIVEIAGYTNRYLGSTLIGQDIHGTGATHWETVDGDQVTGDAAAFGGVGTVAGTNSIVEFADNSSSSMFHLNRASSAAAIDMNFRRARNSSADLQSGDQIASLAFWGRNQSAWGYPASYAASIQAYVDGVPGASYLPGRMMFFTADTAGPTERLRIDNAGNIIVKTVGAPVEFTENGTTDIAAGAANTARLYCRDNGAGKTQLCVRFNSGAVQVIATEP